VCLTAQGACTAQDACTQSASLQHRANAGRVHAKEELAAYKPHRLEGAAQEQDWMTRLELNGARSLLPRAADAPPLRVLVLCGSLRRRSFSRLLAYEFARRAARVAAAASARAE
jgi:hypothetical protein